MNKYFIITLFTILFLGLTNQAEAKGIPIPFATDDNKLSTLLDLPNDSTTFVNIKGTETYANIGCFYKQVWFVWVPIWNYDETYCVVYEGVEDTYGALTKEEAEELAKEYDLKLPSLSPPFWDKIGGKLVIGLLILLIIWAYLPKRNN